MITQEQAEQIKQQLIAQLTNFPEEKREQIKEKIISMNLEEMEDFVKQNQLLDKESDGIQNCIFCLIIDGKMKSYKIAEDKDNIAILEINPTSKGHTLVLPKEHLEKLPKLTLEYAEKLAEKIQKRLGLKDIKVKENNILGHALAEIIPQPETKRKKAEEKELEELQTLFTKEEEKKEEVIQSSKEIKEVHKRKSRIP